VCGVLADGSAAESFHAPTNQIEPGATGARSNWLVDNPLRAEEQDRKSGYANS
jgi:hypothetical protein